MPIAAIGRARHADRIRLGVLTFRVVLARGEPAVAADLGHEITAALRACQIELNCFRLFLERSRKLAFGVGRARKKLPVPSPFFDQLSSALLTLEIGGFLQFALDAFLLVVDVMA